MTREAGLLARKAKEACGLFGIYGHPQAVEKTFYGLWALQHRGQESAGIASTDGKKIVQYKGMGLVGEVFQPEQIAKLRNPVAIGHVRYSTTGSSNLQNAQPIVVDCFRGPIAVAHNGNLVNSGTLRRDLEQQGSIFQTTCDSEVVLHLLARPEHPGGLEGMAQVCQRLRGAFSLLFLSPKEIVAVRDPWGFRPLCLGKLGDAYVVASETCALELVKATYVRDVEPGELIRLHEGGLESRRFSEGVKPAHCIFEHVYFARPDSRIFGDPVHVVRRKLGERLAEEHPAQADIVIPIPDSGNSAALGYSHVSGLPLEHGFIRNHYVGRTFISPSPEQRGEDVQIKLTPVREVVGGRRVVVVDDSIIRGTTCRRLMRSLRDAGAAEVHMRISCPPTRWPCYYGIDFPTPGELIASNQTVDQIRTSLGVDSLGYLSEEAMLSTVSNPADHYCTACWSGKYRVPIEEPVTKLQHEKC